MKISLRVFGQSIGNDKQPKVERLMDIKNITTWLSLGIATIALVLSQLPSIPSYFALPELKRSVHNSLQVRHYLGDLVLVPFLQINNSGKAKGMISTIELDLAKRDRPSVRRTLVAQGYYLKPDTVALNHTPTVIPFGQIFVAAGETWETYINFYEKQDSARRIKGADIQNRVAESIQKKLGDKPYSDGVPVEIDDELFDEIEAVSDERLSWFEIGEYKLVLKLFGEDLVHPFAQECYSLTVFEGNLNRLDAITEQYRFGVGITFPLPGGYGFEGELFSVECTP